MRESRPRWFVFEDEELASHMKAWLPHLAPHFFGARELVRRLSPVSPLSEKERAQALGAFHAPDSEAILLTIETLREALVLTEEDAEFAFSALPPTPKNRTLRDAFHLYLRSPLAKDWTAEVWALIEALKELTFEAGLPTEMTFVRALDTRYLFGELARAFTYASEVERVETVEPWELSSSLGDLATEGPSRRGVWLTGPPSRCLERAGERVSRWIDRGLDPDEVTCVLTAAPAVTELWRLQLAHRGIPVRLEGRATVSPAGDRPESRLLEALRRDHRRGLKERLRLGALLSDAIPGQRQTDSVTTFLERLKEHEKITAEDFAYLSALLAAPAEETRVPPAARGLSLLSRPALPFLVGRKTLALLGPEALEAPTTPGLLRPLELETLVGAGLPVPRLAQARSRRELALGAWLAGGPKGGDVRPYLFTWAELALEPARPRAIAARESPYRAPSEVPFEPAPRLVLPAKPLSATQLEIYAQCPAKYLYGNRMRLAPSRSRLDDTFPLLFGQLTHSALEHAFADLPPGAVPTEEDLLREFRRALFVAAPTLEPSHPFHLILREQFRRFVRHVGALESQLTTLVGRGKRLHFEKEFALEIEGLAVRGKIDRVDETEEGALLVLDYKTGSVDFSPNHIHAGEHFQALLYLLAAEQLFGRPCAGILFYDLKKGELRRGVLVADRVFKEAKKAVTRGHCLDGESFAQLKAEGMKHLARLATRIHEGDFSPSPSSAVCDRCDFSALCRRGIGYA